MIKYFAQAYGRYQCAPSWSSMFTPVTHCLIVTIILHLIFRKFNILFNVKQGYSMVNNQLEQPCFSIAYLIIQNRLTNAPLGKLNR